MQKTPSYSSSPTAVSLILLAATMPFNISSAQTGDVGSPKSSLAQREIIRRTQAVVEADRLFNEGREAYAKQDFQKAVDNYKQALGNVKDVPALVDRHQSYTQHLADASVALAQQQRKVGKYDEARQLLEGVLAPDVDPDNAIAKTELGYLDDPIRTNPVLTHDHVKNVDQVRRKLYMAQGYYDLGKYNEAKKEYEDIIRIDPFNEAARRGMEKIASAKSDYYRAAYGHTRAELLMQVDEAWELSVPADVPTVVTDTTGGDRPSDGVAAITEKLRTIIIPRIDFEDRTVEEAIDYLRLRAAELDPTELDPAKKGVNLVIRRPAASSIGGAEPQAGGDALLGGAAGDLGSLRIDELRLRNVPLAVALKYICDKTKLRYKVDDFAVTLVPITEEGDDMFTRTFRVPPDFVTQLNSGNAEGAAPVDDPFAAAGGGGGANASLSARPPILELLKRNGINFAEGSAATLGGSGSLLVTNTASELDKVEQLVDLYRGQQPKQVKITTKFVEITQENSDELGFDWVFSPIGGSGGDIFGMAGTLGNGAARTAADFVNPVDGTLIPGIPTSPSANVSNSPTSGLRSGDYAVNRNSIDSILNNPNRTAQNPKVAPGILGVTGLFSDGQVQMIMRGLAQKKGSDLMTAPSVTTRSGQTAKIEVIREFIYPTEYEPPEIPQNIGGGGNNNNNNGGGIPANIPVTPATPTAWETKNTGVTLEIEPTIGENDFVIDIRFLPQIVEFEGFVNFGSPVLAPSVDADGNPLTLVVTENRIEMPVFSIRSVTTQLTIYDGYTVAVGGLMREDVQIIEDKVPILGDLPVIGRLFQSEAENRIKSNLIIFVTAEIIDATGKRLRGEEPANVPAETIENVSPLTPDGTVLPPVQGDGLPIE